MPYKDYQAKLASQRRHYASHREQVIANVARRKRTAYAGVCLNCGGPTMGSSKNDIPEWCAKPDCARAQRKVDRVEKIRRAVASWNIQR